MLYVYELETSVAADSELSSTVEAVYDGLLVVPGPDGNSIFANAGVHVLRRTPALLHRIKLPGAWMRVESDPQLSQGDPQQIAALGSSDAVVFESSDSLISGIYMMDAYVGPLLGALSPSVWAFSASRSIGAVIYTLGQPLAGTRGSPGELLQVLSIQGALESVPVPSLSKGASTAAVEWWGRRLNDLFGVLSDLAVFTDKNEQYFPPKHLHSILSVEQIFRRVSSIQSSYRDANARRVLLFTVLDTLERLTGRKIEKVCKLNFATETLEKLRSAIPADAAEVLLPAAERAVKALEELQDGFYIARQKQSPTVSVPDSKGVWNELSLSVATAKYVRVLRNATHGHGSEKGDNYDETNTLLTEHSGDIPHDLALLGWLYLLRMLIEPDSLKKRLYAGGFIAPGR